MVRKFAGFALAVFFSFFAITDMAFGASTTTEGSVAARPTTVAARGVPLYLEKNQGQTDGQVRYIARAGGYTAFLTGHETVLLYHNGKPGLKNGHDAVVRMSLDGSLKTSSVEGVKLLPGIVNYLIGNDPSKWHTRIPTYAEVDSNEVYPGVDLAYRPDGEQLEFDFRVAPGANPAPIRMVYSGASKMHLNAAGDLVLDTNAGPASILKPVAYQDAGGKRVPVAVRYALDRGGRVGFHIGKYDRSRALVIDPTVGPSIWYSTYLGSGTGDTFTSIAVDAAGEAFITGSTFSASYPTGALPGYSPYDSNFPSNYVSNEVPAGFVTALNSTGTGIIYSTFISGDSGSSTTGVALNGIAVDSTGFAFVGGQTDDSTFPTLKAFQSSIPSSRTIYGDAVGVVFELSQHGDSLIYSSFIGGGDYDTINAIALDSSDNAYITGTNTVQGNSLTTSGFPLAGSAIWGHFTQQNIGAGFTDAFAAKIAPPTTGNATLAYSTVIGSAGSNTPFTYGKAIAVDSSGDAYVTGSANCNIGDHGGTITTNLNMTHVTRAQTEDVNNVWVLELNPTATAAVYIAYLGGGAPSGMFSPNTSVAGIKVDSTGQAYVAGTTEANNFQTTSGAYQTTKQLAGVNNSGTGDEQFDGFVTVIAAGGASFAYSTYLNGTTESEGGVDDSADASASIGGIALGTGGQFAVAGLTYTTNFPQSGSPAGIPLLTAFPACPGTCPDDVAFIAKFTTSGLVYSTLLGAGNESAVNGVASNGTDIYVLLAEPANGLTSGGAYNRDNSSGLKELALRVQDAVAIPTTVAVDAQTVSPSASAQTISLTSTIDAASTVNGGVVTYSLTNAGSAAVGSAVTSGIVSAGLSPVSFILPAGTPVGTYTITAYYDSAEDFLISTGTGSMVVAVEGPATTTTVTSSLNPSVYGQSVTFTATVSSASAAPTGTVQFEVDGVDLGGAVALTGVNGTSSAAISTATTAILAAGSPHTVLANFVNTGGAFSNSSGTLSAGQTVTLATQATLAVTGMPGTAEAYAATFTVGSSGGSGTGAVTFGATGSCSVSSALVTMTSGSGTCSVTATKATDGDYATATSTAATVGAALATQATLTVTGVPVTAQANGAAFTVGHTGGSGTGAVTFSGTGSCSASGTTVTMTSSAGICSVTATKATDGNYASATSAAATVSAAASTTISGTVYMPNATNVLPNVLVYVTTTTPAALVSGANCPGVNCLTQATAVPAGVTSYTYTAVDGTFTLSNVPQNTTYTLVIQAGHWRRQFSQVVGATAITGLSLSMPSTHTQGDIPLIAIATGNADAAECVFRDLGLSDNEMTDDTVSSGATLGGRIHLYKGNALAGAEISASTPNETALMGLTSTTLLTSYDMVMFPCQGSTTAESSTYVDNLLAYTSSGGRAFVTHDSRVWLNTAESSGGATFSGVAAWKASPVSTLNPDPGVATINTSFTDGSRLAQWLFNGGYSDGNTLGEADTGTLGQVEISTLRWDLTSINAPAQSWLTLNADATTSTNPVMQFSFNTPFGAAADAQYGRVMFNEYHVETVTNATGKIFPAECPTLTAGEIAQEKMLEYALFDLSNFVTPVVLPTASIAFTTVPSNSIFTEGDTTDTITVDVTNTSSTVPLDTTTAVTVTLPAGITATAMADSSAGGWICNVGTLTCARNTTLAASASDSLTLTVTIANNATGGLASTTPSVSATVSSATFSSSVTASDSITLDSHAVVTWATPAAIADGTPLSSTQLNAVGNTTGTYVYTLNSTSGTVITSGTVLPAGSQTLWVTFTPSNQGTYPGTATATVTLAVNAPVAATASAPAATNFGSEPVASTTGATAVTFTMLSAGTIGTPVVLTQGVTGLDFIDVGTGTCDTNGTSHLYAPSTTCTVNVTFAPRYPGQRYGAVQLEDGSGNILATAYIYGVGTGPQVTFANTTTGNYAPATQTLLGSGFNNPTGVAVDGAGNIFVADNGNNAVKEILAAGGFVTINTLGSGFSGPASLAVDGAGNVFVADGGSSKVKEILASGGYTTVITLAASFTFSFPDGVAVDGSGNVFVADQGAPVVYEIVAPGYTTVNSLASGFSSPHDVAVDGSGDVFVGDSGNHAVKEIIAPGYTVVNALGSGFSYPGAIALDPAGDVFVADGSNGTVKEILAAGGYTTVNTMTTVGDPQGLAVDASGNVFIADAVTSAVRKLTYAVPALINFATATAVGTTDTTDGAKSVAIENVGNAVLTFTASGLTAPADFLQSIGSGTPRDCASGGTVAAGAVCNLSIEFAPTVVGNPLSESFVLTDNALNVVSGTQSIALRGNGIAPTITFSLPASTTLTAGAVAVSYSVTFQATGGTGPYTYGITGGSLPAGMSLSSAGALTGTPTMAGGPFSFAITATDSSTGTGPYSGSSPAYSLTINQGTATVLLGSLAQIYTGAPLAATATTVPTGLTVIFTYTGVGGTTYGPSSTPPTATGVYSVVGTISDANYAGTATGSFVISPPIGATAPSAFNIGSEPVGGTTGAASVIFTFTGAGVIGAPVVLTQGSAGLDFIDEGSGTCDTNGTSHVYSVEDTCAVNVTFAPQYSGPRNGAVLLEDGSGNILATAFIYGIGTGPQATFAITTSGTYAPATQAALGTGFIHPGGVALDGAGDVFVADSGNSAIKEMLAAGGYSTINTLGSGFSYPQSVALDGAGNVFVADNLHAQVKEILAAGGYTTVNTLGSDFSYPVALAVDGSGNVFVADSGNNAVKEILASGGYTTVNTLGSGFNNPQGVAVDGSGNVFVGDSNNNAVKEILAEGGYTTVNTLSSVFNSPCGVSLDGAGDVFVADSNNNAVEEILAAGGYVTVKTLATSFNNPTGVTVDGSGNVLVADFENNVVDKLNYASVPTLTFATPTAVGTTDTTDGAKSVAVENAGNAALTFTSLGLVAPIDFVQAAGSGSPADCVSSGTVAAGAVCNLSIKFEPTIAGSPLSESFVLTDNSLNASAATQSIPVAGTAIAVSITLLPSGPTLTAGTVGVNYSGVTFTATGGTGPYSYSHTGTVPAGLTLSSVGVFSGTPTVAGGPYSFTVIATDSGSATGSQVYSLTIGMGTATVTLGSLAPTYTGAPLAATATTAPTGLTVNFTYTGTGSTTYGPSETAPTSAGSYTVVGTISDENYAGTATGTLVISQAAQADLDVTGMPGTAQAYGATFTVGSSGGSGAGAVTFNATGSCSVSGTTVTMTSGTGTCSVTATKAANGNYTSATSATRTVSATLATQATLTVTGMPGTAQAFGATFTVGHSGGSGTGAVTFNATGSCSVSGTSVTMTSGAGTCSVTATKAADGNYASVTSATATVTAGKAAVTVSSWPAASSITYGQTLASSILTGGTSSVAGAFEFTTPGIAPGAGTASQGVTFTPTDNVDYAAITGAANVTVNKATPTVPVWPTASSITYGQTLAASILSGGTGSVSGVFTWTTSTISPSAGSATESVTFTPTDTADYNTTAGTTSVVVNKATATVTLGSLAQTYTGSMLAATAATTPTGLTVNLTYNGSSTVPTGAGSYIVVGTISSANYSGSNSGVLVISQAAASLTLGNLSQTYTGSPLAATATTTPTGLTVSFTYNGSSTAPTAVGSYAVVGTISNADYSGSNTGTLVISQATASVALGNLTQTYTGSPLAATAITAPTGLMVNFTYNGSSTAPTAAGSYTVVGAISSANYSGTATGTFVISKATATVFLGNLSQTYTGAPLAVTATTAPTGLTVSFTYNGSSSMPTAAGSYVVVGTIGNANYAGSSTATLVISQVAAVASVASNTNPALAQSPITFTATVSSQLGTPTGTVSFLDGTTALGQGTLSGGVGTLTTSSLAAGLHSITGLYGGDTNFVAATSGALTQSVLNFNLTPATGSGTVPSQTAVPGGTATYPLAILPTSGTIFPAPITLTVTGLPEGATWTITPAAWTQLESNAWSFPANIPIVNPTLTIQLPSVSARLDREDPISRKLPPLLWAILLLPLAGKLRRAGKRLGRTISMLLLLALGMGAMFGLSGCGSTSGLFSQQQRTYTVTVTATSGTLSHSTTVMLTVE